MLSKYKMYTKKSYQLLRPYEVGENMDGITVTDVDKKNGSPKEGDMVAVSKTDGNDKWLVSEKFFKENYEVVTTKRDKMTERQYIDVSDIKLLRLIHSMINEIVPESQPHVPNNELLEVKETVYNWIESLFKEIEIEDV